MQEARTYLNFSAKIYEEQHRKGRVFLHEHPMTALSWAEPAIKKIMNLSNVRRYELDMCQFGLQDDKGELLKKPTAILTNSATMGKYLSRRCKGNHTHGICKGGNTAAKAAIYTPQFCEAVVEAYKLHVRKCGSIWKEG